MVWRDCPLRFLADKCDGIPSTRRRDGKVRINSVCRDCPRLSDEVKSW
ncbi:MAG: hypothetical protein NC827_09885 [Candidatus Omnitrophica bacterium]|nr:hypothetical protein [Candidatus Omnitrophota bacterium]